MTEILSGRLASGIGQGRHFTRLEWARSQFVDKLGIDPYPGTVNVIVDDPEIMAIWQRLKCTPGVAIENPGTGPYDCDGRCWPVTVAGRIAGAIVWPEVEGYPAAQIEVIAEIDVRAALGIDDGDKVTLELVPRE